MHQATNPLGTRVEIFLAARNLKNKDVLSKSDPFCIIYLENNQSKYYEIGRTSAKKNNLNPNWSDSFIVDYFFEVKQNIRFEVYDYDDSSPDSLGNTFSTIGELVSKGTSILNLSIGGSLVVRIQEVKNSRESFIFGLRGIKLDKKDTFGKSDPYLIFYKSIGENQWTEVHRTEVVQNTLDPIWRKFELSEQNLCNCDRSQKVRVECYDWDRISSHDLIGVFEVPFINLITPGSRFELYYAKKKRNAGTIEVMDVTVKLNLSFIDYLRVGVQLSLSVAIDFTGSNLNPKDPHSLHYLSDREWNQYQMAIWEVGGILEAYDTDKFFPVFGFGGIPHNEKKVNHCFPLTGDYQNPFVRGVDGILQAYYKSLREVELSGPTLFHHIIDQTINVAASRPPHEIYHVLLILTDGAIMDMPDTISSIVQASVMPISIIIVGVGQADFGSMEELDCDRGLLRDRQGRPAARDIVQFVPFNQFRGNAAALAAQVLKEVPGQLTRFMQNIGYSPPVPEMVDIRQVVVNENPHEGHSAHESHGEHESHRSHEEGHRSHKEGHRSHEEGHRSHEGDHNY